MSSILNKLLSVLTTRRREYMVLDQDFNILETSLGLQRFADSEAFATSAPCSAKATSGKSCPNDAMKGQDVRVGFPELIGLEDILFDIIQDQETSFELKGIGRSSSDGTPLYFDLYIIKNQYESNLENRLIILIEDVTESMVLEQTLIQASNEKSLLLSTIEASKAYVDKIFISMADALLVTTPSGIIKTVNQATQYLFGYSEEELIGKPISLIIGDDKFFPEVSQQNLLLNEALRNVEIICQTKIGEKVAIAFSCSAIQTDIEDLQNFIYIGRDITERQRAQKRLAAQYVITHILSESTTLKETLLKILKAICENLGWDLGELWTPEKEERRGMGGQGGQGEDFVQTSPHSFPSSQTPHPNPRLKCVKMWVQPLIDVQEYTSVTWQTHLAPGEGLPGRIWMTCSPHWIPNVVDDENFVRSEAASQAGFHGGFGFPIQGDSELLGVMTFYSREVQRLDEDLLKTMAAIGNQLGQFIKRKQAEAALAESEERYRDLFENASDLIQSCALNGQFVYVNRAWRETLGYSEDEVQQMNLFDVVHPDFQGGWLEIFSRVMSGEKLDQVTSAFISKDGQKISVEGNINCRFVAGKPVATRAIFRDITERLQAEEALRHQQEKTERLLLNILPEPIADRLKQETRTIAENFAEVSVMFADIVGFTQIASSLSPIELIDLLNLLFCAFDRLSEKHSLEKIKTVGDAYMVVGGLPTRRADHAEAIAEMALDIQSAIAQFREDTGQDFNIRIGINTGPVVAGVIGIKKFSYDLWGDTVNIASRMESHGVAGQIQVTASTYEHLQEKYLFYERGSIPIKGKGEMTTYFLIGRKFIT